jgi:hypothetical protein
MKAIVAGPDAEGIGEALEAEGVTVVRVESPVFAEELETAGITEAEIFVLTDPEEGISIPLAKEANPELTAVCYGEGTLPESVKGMVDLVIDPALLSATAVAEELVAAA